MRSALIIGSGPAGAGVALGLQVQPDLEVTVIDVGASLEPERENAVLTLRDQQPADWDDEIVSRIVGQPVSFGRKGLPQKRAYASDFPFRDAGQLRGLSTDGVANGDVVSGAYGGFSNVWGAQIMPFPRSVTDAWPIGSLEPHYRAILDQIPFAAEPDDLAEHFPLLGAATPLPVLAQRSSRVLDRYDRHRDRLRSSGIRIGRARLALDGSRCVRTGLCLTGCPYGFVYSASHTFDRLRQSGRISYRSGLLAIQVSEDDNTARVVVKDLATGKLLTLEADRVYVACGGVGSTRLAAGSLGMAGRELTMAESQQFVLPMLSVFPTPDPRPDPGVTLNQFTMTLSDDDRAYELAQVHYYTYNPAFDVALPAPLRWPGAGFLRGQVLRRVTAAIGYLPSWHSPRLAVSIGEAADGASLPAIRIGAGQMPMTGRAMLRRTLRRMLGAGRFLDLYPFLPSLSVSSAGKSYHFGGSFPHADTSSEASSDPLGRPGPWRRIHLVDASVFPTVPATTFTLTVMANAHRIATETAGIR